MTDVAVSVVVLNWNGRELLDTCLLSLKRQTCTSFEVLLVDNGSTDGSAEHVRARHPWARLVALDRNYGFCGGNNRGVAAARGRHIVLLNNDTECDPGFLQALVDAVEASPEVGLCASRMIDFHDRSRVDSCGIGLLPSGNGYPIGLGAPDGPAFAEPRFVFGACAGAALYRRAMLDEIGVLDEAFFSHVEDTDLSWRAQLAGYRCLYVPGAIVYHMAGATSRRVSRQVRYRIQRNQTWAYLKNAPPGLLLGLLPLHALNGAFSLLRSAFHGDGGAVWEGKRDSLRAWRDLVSKRRDVQGRRRVSSLRLLAQIDWLGRR